MTPKFSLIATLVVGLMASVANAEVKISGKIGFGVDGGVSKVDTYYANGTHTSTKQDVRTALFDDTSYIRFRGNEKVNDALEFLYQAEVRARYDEGERYDYNSAGAITRVRPRQLEMREISLGVKHKDYGTLKAGRLDTADENITSFTKVPTRQDGLRINNMFEYESPRFKDTRVWLQYGMDENNSTDYVDTDIAGFAIKKSTKTYDIGGAYYYANATSRPRNNGRDLYRDFARVAGRYDLNKHHTLGFMYQRNTYHHQTKDGVWTVGSYGQAPRVENGYSLTYEYNTGKNTIYDLDLVRVQNLDGKDRIKNEVRLSYLRQINKSILGIIELNHSQVKENIPEYNGDMARKVETNNTSLALMASYRF